MSDSPHLDVLIVGAGLSGIGAAHHLQAAFPHRTYAIFEARDTIGGTWDLFRYPGIRSDSDMQTLGYRFRPWTEAKSIADGPSILRYIRQTAGDGDIERHIRFHHRIERAEWSTDDARWTVHATRTDTGEAVRVTCGFLFVRRLLPLRRGLHTAVHRHRSLRPPDRPPPALARGPRLRGQARRRDRQRRDGRHAGAGDDRAGRSRDHAAALAELRRTVPGADPIANGLRRILPDRIAYPITRWKNVVLTTLVYQLSRRRPRLVKAAIRAGLKRQLPKGFDVDTHFKPQYQPWDQRMCIVHDGDLFRAIRAGRASVVTDRIATFTERGIELESGAELEADVIVTATGLNLQVFGRREVERRRTGRRAARGHGPQGHDAQRRPELRVHGRLHQRLLDAEGRPRQRVRLPPAGAHGGARPPPVRAVNDDPSVVERPLLDFTAGYVQRSVHEFPKQGSKAPWQLGMNYAHDLVALRHGPVDDGAMRFSSPQEAGGEARPLPVAA